MGLRLAAALAVASCALLPSTDGAEYTLRYFAALGKVRPTPHPTPLPHTPRAPPPRARSMMANPAGLLRSRPR